MKPSAVVRGLVVASALCACHADPLGKPCTNDDICGPGYGCTFGKCIQLCVNDTECRRGQSCVRYHCVNPQTGLPSAVDPGVASGPVLREPVGPNAQRVVIPPAPPGPDGALIELRAIRRELELIRQDQQKIREMVEKKNR